MIPRTALSHPSYLLRIKAAVLRAVEKSHSPRAVKGIGFADVYNRHGEASLEIVARRGRGFEVFDEQDNDVTEPVKAALVAYHASQRA